MEDNKCKAEKYIEEYLLFKEWCVKKEIFNIDEIIKLFEKFKLF